MFFADESGRDHVNESQRCRTGESVFCVALCEQRESCQTQVSDALTRGPRDVAFLATDSVRLQM